MKANKPEKLNKNMLTTNQREQLIRHMNTYEDDSFELHAYWAKNNFGVDLTKDECYRIYAESLVNVVNEDIRRFQQMTEKHGGLL